MTCPGARPAAPRTTAVPSTAALSTVVPSAAVRSTTQPPAAQRPLAPGSEPLAI